MTVKYLTSWLLAALCGLLLVSADGRRAVQAQDKKDDKTEFKTPATPEAALVMATEALLDGQEAKFLAAFKIKDDKEKELLKALVRFVSAGQKFKTAFIQTYTEKAWEKFNDPKHDPGNGEGNARVALLAQDEVLTAAKGAKITMAGDTANCTITYKNETKTTWKFVKEKDGWLALPESFTGDATDIEKTTKILNGFADLLPKYQRAIGKDGLTADDIDVELGKAVIKELFGFETKPPRFDVNKYKE
jgi:hypothetical protein